MSAALLIAALLMAGPSAALDVFTAAGDSHTVAALDPAGGWTVHLGGLDVRNVALAGTRADQWADALYPRVTREQPFVYVSHLLGTNDVLSGVTADEYAARMLDLATREPTGVLLLTPSLLGGALGVTHNATLAAYRERLTWICAAQPEVMCIDVQALLDPATDLLADDVHWTPEAHQAVGALVQSVLSVPEPRGGMLAGVLLLAYWSRRR